MCVFSKTVFYFIILSVPWLYTALSASEQIQEESSIDKIILSLKQESSQDEYGKRLYEEALHYAENREDYERNLQIYIRLIYEAARQNYPPALTVLAGPARTRQNW